MAEIISLSAYRQGQAMTRKNAAAIFQKQTETQRNSTMAMISYGLERVFSIEPQRIAHLSNEQELALFSTIWRVLPEAYQIGVCNVINRYAAQSKISGTASKKPGNGCSH